MDLVTVFSEATPMLLQGMWITVKTTVVSLLIASVLGLLSCMLGLSKHRPVQWVSKFYVWAVRGTPVMVQVMFIYFGLTQFIQAIGAENFRLTPFAAGVITLSLNAGAYMSEIFRGGVAAVDKGQMEAARSLGLSKGRAMLQVVFPQAFRISIPSLVNQFIITLKDTSIISVISLGEIVYQANIYIGRTMESFATWILVGLMYLVVISILSYISKAVERKFSNGKQA